MTVWEALGLGVLQGATEFLPVSSSGHLALAEYWLGAGPVGGGSLLFDVVVHTATLLAIVVMLRARVLALLRAGLSFLPGARSLSRDDDDRRLALLIVLGSLPTAAIGLLLKDVAETAHGRPLWIGAALLVTAGLLVFSERVGRRERPIGGLGALDALLVGTLQGLAVLPGISRSGATVAAALARDVRGEVAVEFSLLLSIPAIAGASLLLLLEGGAELGTDGLPLAVGFAAALGTGLVALRALQWVVTRRRLLPFAVYCGAVGLGAIVLG